MCSSDLLWVFLTCNDGKGVGYQGGPQQDDHAGGA